MPNPADFNEYVDLFNQDPNNRKKLARIADRLDLEGKIQRRSQDLFNEAEQLEQGPSVVQRIEKQIQATRDECRRTIDVE